MSAHLIPATAGAFADIQITSTQAALATIKGPHEDQSIQDWIAFLTHPDLPRSGFGIRKDIPSINASAAWHIKPDDVDGALVVWRDHQVIVFTVKRGDRDCEDALAQLFGFSADQMPPLAPIDVYFSRGEKFEDAHTAFFTEISPILRRPNTVYEIIGDELNFLLGVEDPQVKATMDNIRAALADPHTEARIPARLQAREMFPAFALWDTETTRRIDAGAPLTQYFRDVHGVLPSTIKALRAHYDETRYPPHVFAGVYGPDVPTDRVPMRSFRALLGFAHKNNIPFRFFAPLANRFSTGICDTFIDYMCSVLADVPEDRINEIFEKNGAHRLMIRNAEAVRDSKARKSKDYGRADTMIEQIPDLTVRPVRAAAYTFCGMSLRLVTSARELYNIHRDVHGIFIEHVKRDGVKPGPIGHNVTFYVTYDQDPTTSGYYVEFDEHGRPLSAFHKRFNMLRTYEPEGFETVEQAMQALMNDLDTRADVALEISKISKMPARVSWSRRFRSVVDGLWAAQRRDDSMRDYKFLGYDTEALMRQDIPDNPVYDDLEEDDYI